MKAAQLMVQCLEAEGVEYVFGIPGEENLDFLDALRTSKIRFIATRHEQAAGFMAATIGRLTGKPGVALSTLGPGATNFLTATAYAHLGGWPALFVTGQKAIHQRKQAMFQIIDVVSMMRGVTKQSHQIVDGHQVPVMVRNGFRVAMAEKPGPVHLELPEDVASSLVPEALSLPEQYIESAQAPASAIEKAAEMIEQAKRPLLLLASACNREDVSDALRGLVDGCGIYFFSTQMGKGVIDERHLQCLGTAALSEMDYLHCAIERADLIINVGHDVTEKPPFLMQQNGQSVIHIAPSPATMDDVYFPQHEVVGCISSNIQRLGERLRVSEHWDFDYYRRIREEIEAHVYLEKADAASFPNVPQRIVADVRAAMPEDGVLSLDNGMYKIWFARNYPAYQRNTLLLDNALATMGAGLPVAIGAKIAQPERDVVAICGDGGFMMNSQELETAVRLGLDLVVIVLCDQGYGMIKWKQAGDGFPDFGLDFSNPDFVKYAESYGAKGIRITETGQLEDALRDAMKSKGVHLLAVPVDYSENRTVFLQALRQKTCII